MSRFVVDNLGTSGGGYPQAITGATKFDRHEGVREKRENQRIPAVAIPLEEKPPHEKLPQSALIDDVGKIWTRHAEATWVELFYDLFFVANLTTFTDSHQINDSDTLQSYIGYFAILWFTWLQAALFDLRFGKDSLIQRVAKALQIGVMVGFSAVNSKFDPRYPDHNWQAFKTLSLLLFASRFAIAMQYFIVWWTVRQYTKTKMPLLLMSILMAISMLLFLGLAFSFSPTSSAKGYVGWYVILALEAMLVLGISLKWKVVSFEGTHLIQRMGLLTLIVMGEGIIGLCRATSLTNEGYFIYMLYFDDEPNYVYSTVPQQIWAILHFPFHLGVVLFVEGQQQLMIWQGIITGLNILGDKLNTAYNEGGENNGDLIANLVLKVIDDFFPDETAKIVANEPAFVFNLAPMRDSSDPGFIAGQIDKLWDLCAYAIFSGYHIEAPASSEELYNSDDKFSGFSRIYYLVVVYFFVAAGGFLLVLALFTYLMKWPKDRFEWLHISYRVIFGIILALVAVVRTNPQRIEDFVTSPWVVPMMMLLLLILLIIDKLTILAAFKYSDRKMHHHKWFHGQGSDETVDSQQELVSTSVSSVTATSSSSSTTGSGLPAMPGADNPAPDPSGGAEGTTSSSSFEGYPHISPPRSLPHTPTFVRGNSRDYYVAPSQLEQVAEVLDEDDPNIEINELPDEDLARSPQLPHTGLHVVNPSIHSVNENHSAFASPVLPAGLQHIPITHRHLHSPIPTHLRDYNDFISPPTPPLGTTYYEGQNNYNPYGEERSLKSPVTVIRRSFESVDSLIPRPLNLKSRNGSKTSSSNISRGDRVSTDMPQTHRGFMAIPVGFVEGEEGRVEVNRVPRRGWNRSRSDDKGIGGMGKFMRSTESMMGVRQ
ncbi:hypothetical protein H072_4591 [Dactylellina haptotyla CBS 200.50]|uniref:Uncharacterized protein n=1 Tax=Dactylellina haptotyla (strain CBS 200.50) TaxID=1284197 RepID=S8AF73_DACHA|nr:hypothetical protein H072_4591 [Dactylellina haptotyla CBS 200.50]